MIIDHETGTTIGMQQPGGRLQNDVQELVQIVNPGHMPRDLENGVEVIRILLQILFGGRRHVEQGKYVRPLSMREGRMRASAVEATPPKDTRKRDLASACDRSAIGQPLVIQALTTQGRPPKISPGRPPLVPLRVLP